MIHQIHSVRFLAAVCFRMLDADRAGEVEIQKEDRPPPFQRKCRVRFLAIG